MKSNIKSTLLQKLFIKPNMVNQKKEFLSLQKYIFPCINNFIEFLSTNDLSKQYKLADQIIKRFCFEMHFPPPYLIMKNILEFEDIISIDEKRKHISRDHFLHLVHLYLLGIYVFFYHNTLNKKIFNELKNLRINNDLSKEQPVLRSIKDFIKYWRFFVLYHDIGYPIELLFGTETNQGLKEKQVHMLSNIHLVLLEDIFTKAFSELIVMYQMGKCREGVCLKSELMSRYDCKTMLNDNGIEESYLKDYYEMEILSTKSALRIILNYFDDSSVIAILKNYDNCPLFFVDFYKKDCFQIKQVGSKKNFDKDLIIKKALRNESLKKNDFWSYYVKKDLLSGTNIYDVLKLKNTEITKEYFIQIIESFEMKTGHILSHCIREETFKEYMFEIYDQILTKETAIIKFDDEKFLERFTEKDKSERIKRMKEHILISTKDMITKDLANIFIEDYWKRIEEDKTFIDNPGNLIKANDKVIKAMCSTDGKKDLIEKSKVKIQETYLKSLTVYEYFINTISAFYRSKSISEKNVFKTNNIRDENQFIQYVNGLNFDKIDKKLSENGILKLITLMENYRRNDGLENIDHGISSGLLFSLTINAYNCIIEIIESSKTIAEDINISAFLKLGLGIINTNNHKESKYELDNIFIESLYSVIKHNIYPSLYKKCFSEEFITSLASEPLAFFSILMDSLQPWDRKRNTSYSRIVEKTLRSTHGNDYNIAINNDEILITAENSSMSIDEMNEEYGKYLDEYLEKASIFIRKHLKEKFV